MDYFASLPPEELAGELIKRVDDYYNWIMVTGRLARWRTAFDTYYGQRGQHSSSHITAGGRKGELSFLMSNEYRNLVQHLLVLTQQSRTSLEYVATNTDSSSKASTYIAKGVVEYYRRDGLMDQNAFNSAEIAMLMDTGWVINEWDTSKGAEIRPDPTTGKMIRQGDIYSRARTPLDVIIDVTKPDGLDRDWIIVRDPKNKFDLAATRPEKADEITALQRDTYKDALFRFGDSIIFDQVTSSDIDVFTFFHKKTPALPKGRMFQFMTSKLFYFDGPIPYRKLPGNRICPAEMILSPLGYSNTNDLLALQDVMDALISAAVTNMTTCGVNNIWVKDPANFDFQQLASGMNVMGGEDKPELLQMNKLPPEWFNLANFIIGRMEALSGMNSVARGNTQGKDLSGAAMALLQSMAIQFNSGLSKAVNKMTEDNGNDVIMLTQDYTPEEKVGLIVGEKNRYMVKKYKGKDLEQIQRCYARQSNPLKDTTAGKLTIAQDLLKIPGAIKTISAYSEILDTGNLDSFVESDRTDRLTIDQENEAILRGEDVPVVFTDLHPEHLIGHRRILADPEARKDPMLVQKARAHYDQHLQVWSQTDPNTLAALGMQPIQMMLGQPPPGAGGPPPGPGGEPPPPPGGPEQQGAQGVAAPPPPQNSSLSPANSAGVKGPNMPTNPLTKEKWNPETGGLK